MVTNGGYRLRPRDTGIYSDIPLLPNDYYIRPDQLEKLLHEYTSP